MQELNKNLAKKALTKHPAVSIIILVSNGATRTTKVRAAPFVLSEIAKVLQNLAKAQRGADRIFSDSLKEKSGYAAVRKLPIERGGYQWISYPR